MAPASVAPSAPFIAVTLADFTVMPDPIEATGLTVSLDVTNAGPTPHNLTIRDEAGTILGATPNLSTGEVAALIITVPAGGTYITFCSLPGHESLGLRGELIVTEADATGSPGVAPMASPGRHWQPDRYPAHRLTPPGLPAVFSCPAAPAASSLASRGARSGWMSASGSGARLQPPVSGQ